VVTVKLTQLASDRWIHGTGVGKSLVGPAHQKESEVLAFARRTGPPKKRAGYMKMDRAFRKKIRQESRASYHMLAQYQRIIRGLNLY
jgi:hypothetical protein